MSNSFETPCTIAQQAPLSMGIPRQGYWSGQLFPSAGDLPNPGIEPMTPALQVDSLPLSHKLLYFSMIFRTSDSFILLETLGHFKV